MKITMPNGKKRSHGFQESIILDIDLKTLISFR